MIFGAFWGAFGEQFGRIFGSKFLTDLGIVLCENHVSRFNLSVFSALPNGPESPKFSACGGPKSVNIILDYSSLHDNLVPAVPSFTYLKHGRGEVVCVACLQLYSL